MRLVLVLRVLFVGYTVELVQVLLSVLSFLLYFICVQNNHLKG